MKELEIIFASRNKHKLKEMEYFLNIENNSEDSRNKFKIKLLSLDDINYKDELVENGTDFFANAKIKAVTVRNATGKLCLSDDSGLCVSYLNDAPGVYSSRYAGENASDDDNIDKLLAALKGLPRDERKAKFICVLCLALPGDNHFYTMGECEGYILEERVGTNGFGYDPVFLCHDSYKSFGLMTAEEKNQYSHRCMATKKLSEKLGYYIQ